MLSVSFLLQHFWGYISWCTTALHHFLVGYYNLGKSKIGDLYLNHFFRPRILFDQDVLRFQIPMNNSTRLQILNGLHQLVHDKRYLPLLKFIHFDVLKKFSTCGLVHDDVHILVSLVGLTHLNDIGM